MPRVPGLRGGGLSPGRSYRAPSLAPDTSARAASPLIPSAAAAAPAAASSSSPRSRSPRESSSSPRSQRVRATSPGASSSRWRSSAASKLRARLVRPARGDREQAEEAPDRAPAAAEAGLHEAVGVRLEPGVERVGARRVAEGGARLGQADQAGEAEQAPGQGGEVAGGDGVVGDPRALGLARLDEDQRQRRAPAHADRARGPATAARAGRRARPGGPARAAPRTAA